MRICQGQFPGSDCMECCSNEATSAVGHLVLCSDHTALALEGLLEYDGREASAVVLRDVRNNPQIFPRGVFPWANGLTALPL
jgi:hypothetical protein